MLLSVFSVERLCCSPEENKCVNALVKSQKPSWQKKEAVFEYKKSDFFFFATVPQPQRLFFCVSRQTSLFICQQWQDNDYCLVCCGAICIVSDNRLTGERRTKKQKGPKSQDNDTDFSKRSITGCAHLEPWGTGGFLLPHLLRKNGRFNFPSRLVTDNQCLDLHEVWIVSATWHQHAISWQSSFTIRMWA